MSLADDVELLVTGALAIGEEAPVIAETAKGLLASFEKSQAGELVVTLARELFASGAPADLVAKLKPFLDQDGADDARGIADQLEAAKLAGKPA